MLVPPEWMSRATSWRANTSCSMKCAMRQVGCPAGLPGKARLRLPLSKGEQRLAAITAGRFAAGRIVIAPRMSLGLDQANELEERQLAFVLVAVVAGHQNDARTVAVPDAADRHLDLVVGRAVDRIGEAYEADDLAVRRPIDVKVSACVHGPAW